MSDSSSINTENTNLPTSNCDIDKTIQSIPTQTADAAQFPSETTETPDTPLVDSSNTSNTPIDTYTLDPISVTVVGSPVADTIPTPTTTTIPITPTSSPSYDNSNNSDNSNWQNSNWQNSTESTGSTESKNDTAVQSPLIHNTTLMFIVIPIAALIISLIIGIIVYKRIQKKRQKGTILQFEPMHPHVVIVDADGNSLGKRNSIVSTSNNSFISNLGGNKNRSPSRMIKVLYDDSTEETESIVGKNSRKTMCYEDYNP